MNFLLNIRGNITLRFEHTSVADYIGLTIVNVSRSNRRRSMHKLYRRANCVRFVIENYVRIMHRILEGVSFPSYETDNLE